MNFKRDNIGRVGALRRPDAAARRLYHGAPLKDERDSDR
jgi:hypothetical protein